MSIRKIIIIAVVALAAGAAWFYWGGESEITWADADDAALVALGRTVYDAQCAACHGAKLQGEPDWRSPLPAGGRPAPPHDQTGHTWHHPDRLLFKITKEGGAKSSPAGYVNRMPGFGDKLTDREIWASLAYIKSRWPRRVRDRQESINDRAR